MAFNLEILGDKLLRFRNQFEKSTQEVSTATGIPESNLLKIEEGAYLPTGDEILILADYYKCDYKFFLSNEKLAAFEQTETLFRKFGNEFSKKDRWSVQECLFLAECETYLEGRLNKQKSHTFSFQKTGTFYKKHGQLAAKSLHQHFGRSENVLSLDIYHDMRRIGIRVFRRKLENSNISGLYIKHPVAGKCVLVNYSEDVYRQRFTAAHEAAHTILDESDDVLVSFSWEKNDLKEVRANAFASAYLMPPDFIQKIPECGTWTPEKSILWANKLKVSTQALAIALSENKLITQNVYKTITQAKVPRSNKEDPELPNSLPPNSMVRKQAMLEHGLSDYYVSLCFEGYRERKISAARLTEMLLLQSDIELSEFAKLYRESL